MTNHFTQEEARAALAQALDALEQIIDEKCDYMRRNYLGNPEVEHTVKYGRAALAAGRAALAAVDAKLAKAGAIWQARDKGFGPWWEIDSEHANGMRKLGHEVRVLYTRPLPAQEFNPNWSQLEATQESLREHMAMLKTAQDVNAELVEALEDLADAGGEAWGEERPCVRIARTALANAKSAQQKGRK